MEGLNLLRVHLFYASMAYHNKICCAINACLKNSKVGLKCGSSNKVPALQVQTLCSNPSSTKKKSNVNKNNF
jgi:hypothetical protein